MILLIINIPTLFDLIIFSYARYVKREQNQSIICYNKEMKHIARATKKTLIFIIGVAVFVAGLLLSFPGIPGPGIVLMIAGLAILATEFAWAHHWKQKLETSAKNISKKLIRRKQDKP